MLRSPVVVFSMPDRGHFQRLTSLIRRLVDLDVPTHVFTHERFRDEVEAAGARFEDLFAGGSVDDADDESWPFPVRFVTFAERAAPEVGKAVHAIKPSLVIHDTFAVIGKVVARMLSLPHVNVCAGHQVLPAEFHEILRRHPQVHVSPRCVEAVESLRSRYGLRDAVPFWYVSAFSDDLNLYCEPPEFLAPEHRTVFEPVAFYGSFPDNESSARSNVEARPRPVDGHVRRAYVSFGTMIWPYRRKEALAALESIATAFSQRAIDTTISFGGAAIDDSARAALGRPGITLESYVDQARALGAADVFVTHHGLNSTHEAIRHGVPMISYPFVWDQPGMARTCERLDLATPLTDQPMGAVSVDDVLAAIDRIETNGGRMRSALAVALGWEDAVVAGRPAVVQRMLELGDGPPKRA